MNQSAKLHYSYIHFSLFGILYAWYIIDSTGNILIYIFPFMMSHFDFIMTRIIRMCLKTCQIEKGDVHYHS